MKALVLAGAFVFTGCRIDFLGPESPVFFGTTVTLVDSASTVVGVRAELDPGLLESGDPRHVSDDTLRLLNLTIAPAFVDELGRRSYDRGQSLDVSALNSADILLTPPRVAGTTGNPKALSTALVWRDGPYALQVPRGADVVLSLANVQRIDTTDAILFWSVNIAEPAFDTERRLIFQLSGGGLPPAAVTIPASIVEEARLSTFAVRFELGIGIRSETPIQDYFARLFVRASIYWTVTPVDP